EKPGRTRDDEIIVYSVGGMPVEDIAWGCSVYRKAKELGIGASLNLWEKPEMA
ncbi:MAG: ornithine cyclodeaminase, partial [Lachnospiraceae bacterium]|nr:ornithine cyclodeaminase [Lachnospiraceae bacterium]